MSENDCADTGEPCPVSSIARQLAAARKREERLEKMLREASVVFDGITDDQCVCDLCRADAKRMVTAIKAELGERP